MTESDGAFFLLISLSLSLIASLVAFFTFCFINAKRNYTMSLYSFFSNYSLKVSEEGRRWMELFYSRDDIPVITVDFSAVKKEPVKEPVKEEVKESKEKKEEIVSLCRRLKKQFNKLNSLKFNEKNEVEKIRFLKKLFDNCAMVNAHFLSLDNKNSVVRQFEVKNEPVATSPSCVAAGCISPVGIAPNPAIVTVQRN